MSFGRTPVEYRNAGRIAVAQRLLIDDAEVVNTIAAQCGLATVQQFNRTFRAIVACTPSQYRGRIQG